MTQPNPSSETVREQPDDDPGHVLSAQRWAAVEHTRGLLQALRAAKNSE